VLAELLDGLVVANPHPVLLQPVDLTAGLHLVDVRHRLDGLAVRPPQLHLSKVRRLDLGRQLADQAVRRPVLAVRLSGVDAGHHLVDQVDARRRDQRGQPSHRGSAVGLALSDGNIASTSTRVCSRVMAWRSGDSGRLGMVGAYVGWRVACRG